MMDGKVSPDNEYDYLEHDAGDKKKDWFAPAAASMARLNQIQANIYNIGLQDPSCLKPPKSLRKTTVHSGLSQRLKGSEQKPPGIDMMQRDTRGGGDMKAESPMSSLSHQKSAWGSNSSIPELIARQGKLNNSRPSSASTRTKVRPPSAGRGRPQSAKEPLCERQSPRKVDAFGVLGQRKDVSSKPPPSTKTFYQSEFLSSHKTSSRALAGPPVGYKLEQSETAEVPAAQGRKMPSAPFSSPIGSDEEEDIILQSPKTPPLLRRPLPEPIHLSLPKVEDSAEDKDELDTDRLLQQADHFMLKKMKKEPQHQASLDSIHATTPEKSVDAHILQHPLKTFPSKPRSSPGVKSQKKKNEKSQENLKKDESSSDLSLSDSSDFEDIVSEHTDEEAFSEGGLSVPVVSKGYSPSMEKEKETPVLSANKESNLQDQSCGQSRSVKTSSSRPEKPFLESDNTKLFLPLRESRPQSGKKPMGDKSGVKIREDRNVTVDITPRNIGRKVVSSSTRNGLGRPGGADKSDTEHGVDCLCEGGLEKLNLTEREKDQLEADRLQNMKANVHHRDFKSNHQKSTGTLVSMVTVEYEEEKTVAEDEKKKKKISKRHTTHDVETLVSKLGPEEEENNHEPTMAQLLHKSSGEKNYYELARHYSSLPMRPGSAVKSGTPDSDTTVYKTTKTIEFVEGCPQEISTRSAIPNQTVKPKEELKPPKAPTTPLWPSTIKKQRERMKENLQSQTDGLNKAYTNDEDIKNLNNLEDLIHQAKIMATDSLLHASKQRPSSANKSTEKSKTKEEAAQGGKSSQAHPPLSKPRPMSAGPKFASAASVSHCTHKKEEGPKRYSMYSRKPASFSNRRSIKSAGPSRTPLVLTTLKNQGDLVTGVSEESRRMQAKMAALGVDVDAAVLERALNPPSGNALYYDIPGNLPSDPSDALLTHYKNWLPEDYKRVKLMEQRLAQDDRIKYLQKLAAEKKAKRAAGKKGHKSKKLTRSNSLA